MFKSWGIAVFMLVTVLCNSTLQARLVEDSIVYANESMNFIRAFGTREPCPPNYPKAVPVNPNYDKENIDLPGEFQIESFSMANEDDFECDTSRGRHWIRDKNGRKVKLVCQNFYDSLKVHGIGKLKNGTVVQYYKTVRGQIRFFRVKAECKYGVTRSGKCLEPYRSIEVHASKGLKEGDLFYIDEFRNMTIPPGVKHGGYFLVSSVNKKKGKENDINLFIGKDSSRDNALLKLGKSYKSEKFRAQKIINTNKKDAMHFLEKQRKKGRELSSVVERLDGPDPDKKLLCHKRVSANLTGASIADEINARMSTSSDKLTSKRNSFFEKVSPIAVELQQQTGFPASVMLAQWAYETGYGLSNRSREMNSLATAWCQKSGTQTINFPKRWGMEPVSASCVKLGQSYSFKFDNIADSGKVYLYNLLVNPAYAEKYKEIRLNYRLGDITGREKIVDELGAFAPDTKYYAIDLKKIIRDNSLLFQDAHYICGQTKPLISYEVRDIDSEDEIAQDIDLYPPVLLETRRSSRVSPESNGSADSSDTGSIRSRPSDVVGIADLGNHRENVNCLKYDSSNYKDGEARKIAREVNAAASKGTSAKVKSFMDKMSPLAVKIQGKTGFPASVLLAQWAYETGWGTSAKFKDINAAAGHSCWKYSERSTSMSISSKLNLGRSNIQVKCNSKRPSAEGGYYYRFESLEDSAYAHINNLLYNPKTEKSYRELRRVYFDAIKSGEMPDHNKIISSLEAYDAVQSDSAYERGLRSVIARGNMTKFHLMAECGVAPKINPSSVVPIKEDTNVVISSEGKLKPRPVTRNGEAIDRGKIRGDQQVMWDECDKGNGITGSYGNARCNKRQISKELLDFMGSNFSDCVEQGSHSYGIKKEVASIHIKHAGVAGDKNHSGRSYHAINRAVDISALMVTYKDGSKMSFSGSKQIKQGSFFNKFRSCWSSRLIDANRPAYCPGSEPKGCIGHEDSDHKHHLHISVPFCPKRSDFGVK
jgi:flagellum-specific peptidoglycan hydrolase FlgJ